MTETATAPKAPDYPIGIVTKPFNLDDLTFTASAHNMEHATRGDPTKPGAVAIGDVLRDDVPRKNEPDKIDTFWFARKFDEGSELSDWKPMRSAAEDRAFLVSKIRQ